MSKECKNIKDAHRDGANIFILIQDTWTFTGRKSIHTKAMKAEKVQEHRNALYPACFSPLTSTSLPPVYSIDTLYRLDSPSTPLPISPSIQQGPSGRRGTLSSPSHSPPLGLRENLLHSQVK